MLQDTIHTAFSASLFSSLTCLEKLVTLATVQASMKLSKEQVVSLSSQEMVQNFLISQKHRIADSVKQTLAVAEVLKLEDLKVSKEELETEVENAIAEFKRYNQEYDEERVKEQVLCPVIFHLLFHCGYSTKEMNKSLLHAGLGDQLSSI
jgi:FKBP-type peptidyl-prolyl cis-trans isomerase (trigger factor)